MDPAESSSLELLNPTFYPKPTDTFDRFSRLPPELRWNIWKLALSQERLLHVEALTLEPLTDDRDAETFECPQWTYEVILTECQPVSKLARVNSESRAATSSFYRVQMPCVYRWEGKREAKGTFYFNPELDTLEIRGQYWASLAQDLWVHDPRRIGLANLILADEQCVRVHLNDAVDYPLLEQVIPRLKRVIFAYHGGVERMHLGEPRESYSLDKATIYPSRPIMPATPRFERLLRDPRSYIEASLKKVHLGRVDPRRIVHGWLRLMAKFNEEQNHEIDYRFMVAFEGRNHPNYNHPVNASLDQGWKGRGTSWVTRAWEWAPNTEMTNRCDALRWISDNDAKWREPLPDSLSTVRKGAAKKVSEEVELHPQPVIGFWLFPIHALGPLPDLSSDHLNHWGRPIVWRYHQKIDLSGVKPELCLSYLP